MQVKFLKEWRPERAKSRTSTSYTCAIIEGARKKANISKAELARRLGTDRVYITRIESGQIEPKVSTFYRIAAVLGCNQFDETCQGTMPVVFGIINKANSFEEAIRYAIAVGGDSDTIGAIVGSIAEAIWVYRMLFQNVR